ncbi:CHAT domain-containing protein [Pseudanabaena yagii]|uniref:Tetratricopeptide repeat protein n=1 Tax=Pseudanabaena yagii GIHE-NHR1 TaxID=2722753 RepID=A0ABX1LNI2_9CYAN|nr:tetratricopeptide repeat protein [Pseudanabaena yagii]NMF57678.1 tetratricopeptide repeat protein [Pseudanabaena yagii GIHE-NHR1]
MRKNFSAIAITTLLLGLPVQTLISPNAQAQVQQDSKAEAEKFYEQGNQLYNQGQYREAIESWQKALNLYRVQQNRNYEGDALNNIGNAYKGLGQIQKAAEFYQQALAIKQQIGERKGEARAVISLGNVYNDLGQYQKAIDMFQQALVLKKQANDRVGEGDSLIGLGNAYKNLGKYQQAINFYQQAFEIYKQANNRYGLGLALNNLGTVYTSLSQYQKAIEFYQQALDIRKELNDRYGVALALNNLGTSYNNLGQYPKAIELYQQALDIYKQIGDRYGIALALNNLGAGYGNISQYQKAIDFYQQALEIKKQIGDRNGIALALNNLGITYSSLGQYQKAIDFAQQALEIRKEIGDRAGVGSSLSTLGDAHSRLGQYQKAIEFFQQSLDIRKQIGDRYGEAAALYGLGGAYYRLGQYQKAIAVFQQTLEIRQQIGDRYGESGALDELGYVYSLLGQSQKALDFYQQALAISKQIGDRSGEAGFLSDVGTVYNKIGQYQKAIEFFQQSLDLKRQIGARNGEGVALLNLGLAYNNLGQYQKGIEYYQQALEINKQLGDLNGLGLALNNLGTAYNNMKQYQKAIGYYQQSLELARQTGERESEGRTLSNLGLAFSRLNKDELAILYYKQSINIRESIRKDLRGLSTEEQKSYLSTVEYTYRNLADLLLKQNRSLEAQQVLDLLKVQELSSYLNNVQGNTQTQQGVDLQPSEQSIITLASELNSLQKKDREGNITEGEQKRLTQLVQAEQSQNEKFNSFLNSPEIKKLTDEIRRTEQQQNVNLASYRKLQREVLTQLPSAVMLYPLILDDRLELVLVSANTPPIRRTVNLKREELIRLVADFREGLKDKGSEDVKEPAQKLYKAIIKPFEAELNQLKIDTIIYAPDGQLRYIPLSALYDGKQWLIEKYRINNITAESLTGFNLKPIAPPHVLAGAFGGKDGDKRSGFNGLPATLTEVQKIAARFANTTTLLESDFTKTTTATKANSYTILHLATHGFLSTEKPEDSFILFGNGDKATIRDIQDWSLKNVDLVVLSACETGIGNKLGNGIEILGLGYQMQSAGARVAIASLWQVSDEGTQALMDVFYGELQKGNVSIAEALRRAQIALIRSPQYKHPNYWSAFFAIGNGL